MTIEIDVARRLGDFTLEARFASAGGITALFGRSGSGKTTLVNMIAGLVRPDRGRIAVGGRTLFDGAAGVDVKVHRRRIGYVFQEGRLFPHLTVRQNLLFGRWFTPRTERGERLDHVVELLGLGALLERRPASLSGGEKQRVAIGRALLASPRLLLMDEPLASLDEARKLEILPYIERLRDDTGLPIVYVSHSIAEVVRLAGTVVLLDRGRVAACGPVSEVMARPDLLAALGRAEAGAVLELAVAGHDEEFGLTVLAGAAGEMRVARVDAAPGARMRVRVRARDVMIALARPSGLSALNVLQGSVAEIAAPDGPDADVVLELADGQRLLARLTRRAIATLGLAPGLGVFAVIKSVAFDPRGPDPSAAG